MAMNRIRTRLELAAGGGSVKPLLPYFTSCYPDRSSMAELLRRADSLGVAVAEIGFPYSDSIADGPVVQSSFHEVLAGNYSLRDTFDLVADLRADVSCALVAMVSYTIVRRTGTERFMQLAAEAGFDGLILPDLPVEEAQHAASAAAAAKLGHIGLVAPTTFAARATRIVEASTGFVYRIAISGTTGERDSLPADVVAGIKELKDSSGLPVCVGFGISTPEHVRTVCAVADGAIVGSAIIRRMAEGVKSGASLTATVDSADAFLRLLADATTPASQ